MARQQAGRKPVNTPPVEYREPTTPRRRHLKLACEPPQPTASELIKAAEDEIARSPENHPDNVNVVHRPVEIIKAKYNQVRIYPRSVDQGAWDRFFSRWLDVQEDPELGIRVPKAVMYVKQQLCRNAFGIDLVARDRMQAMKIAEFINYYGDPRYGNSGWMDRDDWVYPEYPEDDEIDRLVQEVRRDRVFELDGRICDPSVLAWEKVAATEAEMSDTLPDVETAEFELGEPVNTSTPDNTLGEPIHEALGGLEIGPEDEVGPEVVLNQVNDGEAPAATNIDWQQIGQALMSDPNAMREICRVMASMGVRGDDKPSQ
jgi:hypothetical protein